MALIIMRGSGFFFPMVITSKEPDLVFLCSIDYYYIFKKILIREIFFPLLFTALFLYKNEN